MGLKRYIVEFDRRCNEREPLGANNAVRALGWAAANTLLYRDSSDA